MADLSLNDIKTLMSMMVEHKIDKLDFNGLTLLKSNHSIVPPAGEPTSNMVSHVTDDVPNWIKMNAHLMNRAPFDPPFVKDEE